MSLGIQFTRFFGGNLAKKCRFYAKEMFSRYLLVTNVGISISSSGLGDFLEQFYEMNKDRTKSIDLIRTRNMAATGLPVGLVCHCWYQILDSKLPGRSFKTAMKKVIIDQIMFSPVCISVFFVSIGILENTDLETLKNEIIKKGTKLYTAEWVIWPPAQVINFYLIPLRFRVLYDNTISLGYDIYTSRVKHEDSPQNKTQENDKETSNICDDKDSTTCDKK